MNNNINNISCNLFTNIFVDSSNDDIPIKVMKKHTKTKSVATSSIIDIPEVSYNFSIESNSNISLGSMSSASNYISIYF